MSYGRLTDTLASFALRGIRIIDPAERVDRVGDLAVVRGTIAHLNDLPRDAPWLDGDGLVAAPGLCDLHAHLRTPGDEAAETLESGTRAAARGGFTSVCAMPNTDPPLDEAARVRAVLVDAVDAAARVRVVAAATRGRAGEQLTDHGALADAGVVGFSDDGAVLPTGAVARRALAYLQPLQLPLVEHAEDPSLGGGTHMRSGPTATRLGLSAWPPSAERAIVERDLLLASETGGWVHFTHLSTAASLEPIRRARAEGIRVTCDVTPHHLALADTWVAGDRRFAWDESSGSDSDLAYDSACRVNPPLPRREDAMALLAAVADGTVDAIATDHAPHPTERKNVPFGEAAPGIIGLETALSLGLAAVEAGRLDLPTLLAALSSRPAALIDESRSLTVGSAADLVVFDPGARWRVEAETLASRSSNTPLLGMELPGVVLLTVAAGRITYDAERLAPAPPSASVSVKIEAR